MPGAVNTAFVLDMQRKLHRWSTEKATAAFEDLFNIVCDRRTRRGVLEKADPESGQPDTGLGRRHAA